MTVEPRTIANPPWLATVLLAEDDTEESVPGSDWHMKAILEAYGPLLAHAEGRLAGDYAPWYVSSQVTVIVPLPRRERPWQPKPDLFVVVGLPAVDRTSYDTRRDGPMPQFVLEVASESTWQNDVGDKRDLYPVTGVQEYMVFDPTGEILPERVRGWHATDDGWQPWPPVAGADSTLVWRSEVLGLNLRVEGPLLRFDHPVTGPLLLQREAMRRVRIAEQDREEALHDREAALLERRMALQRAEAAEQALSELRESLGRGQNQ